MDQNLKRRLLAQTLPAVGLPVLREAISHHFAMKRYERQEEMEMKVAERRAESVRAMAGPAGPASGGAIRRSEPRSGSPGDVYDDLEQLRTETNCSFCHQVIDSLMDAPPDEARRGYDELRSYVREVERMEGRDVSEEEAERIVGNLVDQWDTVPKYIAGAV